MNQQAAQNLDDELAEKAEQFIAEYTNITDEKSEAQNFMRSLCQVYGLESRHAVRFEHRVKGAGRTNTNYVDGFFPGLLLIEMKTAGKDLEAAYEQALDYVAQLKKPEERPLHILVSDFQNLHLYDIHLDADKRKPPIKFKLTEFRQHVRDLDFLQGYERIIVERNEKATIEAAKRVGDLHDAIKATGYEGKDLQSLLVRILFCLFADDTGLFDPQETEATPFIDLIKFTRADASDLNGILDEVFTSLNTSKTIQKKNTASLSGSAAFDLHVVIDALPYVNGQLFEGRLAACRFTPECRLALLHCCNLDWSEISPDIFGNLFQHIMHWEGEAPNAKGGKTKKRREFGAHYTSERNILRAIRPLFLDDLEAELIACKNNLKALQALHAKLGSLTVLDPACGCGNFLVVSYRELRLLEQRLLDALALVSGGQQTAPICDVHQFYGIELDPTAVEIATVAMWLTDHQLNTRLKAKPRIPLKKKAQVVCTNALQTDWNEVLPASECHFIVGNPPFLGKKEQSAAQKKDMDGIFANIRGAGVLDYVAGWYVKALVMMQSNRAIKAAFVSTNSITQGEQVALLWQPLISRGLDIRFAHRTFKWSNDGAGVAAVHCVIIGFGLNKPAACTVWDYSADIKGDGKKIRAKRINPYLVDANFVTLPKRGKPIQTDSPTMRYGSMPIDNGHLIIDADEYAALTKSDKQTLKLVRPYTGGDEFINNFQRYCLWLENIDYSFSRFAKSRVALVEQFRLSSGRETTAALANTPHLFGEIRQPKVKYLLIPKVSSERRPFMPIGFISPKTIASGSALIVPNASLYAFAVLSSTMHMAWMRTVCGRMKSDYQYSASLVYNNYPWPQDVSAAHKAAAGAAGQALLDARAQHEGKSLAWMYNPETMPRNVQDAHDAVDAAVDDAYGYEGAHDDAPRVAFLFERYLALTTLLPQDDDAFEDVSHAVLSGQAAKTLKRSRSKK